MSIELLTVDDVKAMLGPHSTFEVKVSHTEAGGATITLRHPRTGYAADIVIPSKWMAKAESIVTQGAEQLYKAAMGGLVVEAKKRSAS